MTSNETREQVQETQVTEEIVVGLDGGASAAAALRWAAEQSRNTGVPLRVVHAWQLSPLGAAVVTAGSAELWEAQAADARARATRWVLDTLGGTAAEIRWTLDIAEGPPGPVLVGRARHARLLVLGTQEHTGIRRAITGSVSHHCLSHATPPVVAVPVVLERVVEERVDHGRLAPSGPLL